MKKFCLFVVLLCSFVLSFAQSWKELNEHGEKLYAEGKIREATEVFRKCLIQAEKEFGKQDTAYASSCAGLSVLYQIQGKFADAELLSIEAKNIRAAILGREHPDYGISCNNLAGLYQAQGKYNEAEPLLIETKNIYATVFGKGHFRYANSCNNLAGLYKSQSKYTEAETLYKEARNIFIKTLKTETVDYAISTNNFARLCQAQGKYSEAELLLIEAKEIYARVLGKENLNYAQSCNNLAILYKVQGRYDESEKLYQESMRIRAKVLGKEHSEYAQSCINLAVLYKSQGKYSEAETLCLEAKSIISKTLGKGHSDYAISCNNLASLYYTQGKFSEAESLYKEAMDIYIKSYGREHPDYATSCDNLANLYQYQGTYNKAEPLCMEAKNIRAKILGKEHPIYAASCSHLAILYKAQDKYAEAEILLKETISIKLKEINQNFKNLSEDEKEKYIESNVEVYFNDFQMLVSKRNVKNPSLGADAYNLILVSKGLILQSTEKIKNRILASKDETLKKMYLEWKQTKEHYAKVQSLTIAQREKKKLNLDSILNYVNALEKQLAVKSEDFANTFTAKTVIWQDVQKALKEKEAAIEIVRVNAKEMKPNAKDSIIYMALIIKKNSKYPEIVVLSNGDSLENEYLTYYHRSIKTKLYDNQSYNTFWQPLKEKLKNIKTVYFSPQGVYHQVNLTTLQNPDTKKYLSNETQIIYVTNTKDVLNVRSYTATKNYFIGNPHFDLGKDVKNNEKPIEKRTFENLPQLQGAEKEVKEVSNFLKNKQIVIGGQATEEYIKSIKNPRVLHIATHGYFKKEQYQSTVQAMLNAGLLFAGVLDYDKMEIRPLDKEDGKLTAFEVMNMELDSTELVVLSACETGLGQASKEGVYGLQRAFKVAGAQTIIMSLWRVNDEATQLLMTKFYENWQKKGMNKRLAFETAQKDLRQQYKEPYYWGAFVMIE